MMNDEAAGGSAVAASHAQAGASLRETAKWLVGGVVGTSAGIFAGSSLTRLGSMDFDTHPVRLALTIGGAAAGFAALAFILARALAVLTVETLPIETIAESNDPIIAGVRGKLDKLYGDKLPGGATGIAELVRIAAGKWKTKNPEDLLFAEEYVAYHRDIMAQASFLHLRERFGGLTGSLWIAGPFAIVGFGLFAWAANPPEDKPPAKPPIMVINNR